jgi:hypothetical protein
LGIIVFCGREWFGGTMNPNPERRQKVTSEEAHELIDVVIFANWAVNDQKFGFSGHESPDKPSDALLASSQFKSRSNRSIVFGY